MILRNKDRITIEVHDKDEMEKLIRKGFVNFYKDSEMGKGKKKARTIKRSTRDTKGKPSTS